MNIDYDSLIIYEDPHIVVCHKPAGIPVQTKHIGVKDLESILRNHLNRSLSPAECTDLFVIHRLDQPVEGMIVFAKTRDAAKELNRQLTSSGFGKYYYAVVLGVPEPREGILENYMVKNGHTNMSYICDINTSGAKPARLHYQVEEIYKNSDPVTSLVKIKLDTGRHHQIRVQMAHIGCPLLGDKKYGGNTNNGEPLRLCAYRLEFFHPKNRRKMKFKLDVMFLRNRCRS